MVSKFLAGLAKGEERDVPPIPDPDRIFRMPAEEDSHEGTWLQWPHDHDANRRRNLVKRYEESWVQMTVALHTGERVHIVVYDDAELDRVSRRLEDRGCDMQQIDFFAWPTDDVWVRDNGPIFVYDETGRLQVADFGFNGWGERYGYKYSNAIPKLVASALDLPCTTVPMINEGGSVEIDGMGTLMAKRSSILNRNRNPGWTQQDAEAYFRRYLGVRNFIWLDGVKGQDVTDDHIDGTARFADSKTIVTFCRDDFLNRKEYDILANAVNDKGERYRLVHLPLTTRKVVRGDYGFYINFYVANKVVLVPSFDDPNDQVAARKLQAIYGDKRGVVLVPMKEVLKDGGMVHCVTQQQPIYHTTR
jgi:agmatine deiminase